MSDWIGDPNLSREEKLARFEALAPEPTSAPRRLGVKMPGAVAVQVELTRGVSKVLEVRPGKSYSPQMPGTVVDSGAIARA